MSPTATSGCRLIEGRVDGFVALTLENERVRAQLLPALGGRLWTLTQRADGRQWLWHSPKVALHAVEDGADYDDHWAGGWKELFPNDAPGSFDGRDLPDHGEWWSRPWQWSVAERGGERVEIRLALDGRATPTSCEKRVALTRDAARVDLAYRITNIGDRPLRFLLKQHLAVALSPEDRLELPGGRVMLVDPSFGTLVGGHGPEPWPIVASRAGGRVDLSVPPPAGGDREFVYVAELPEGWCGVRDPRTGARLRLAFPRDVCPYVWLFMTFGGWRDLYTGVLEPCTNMPKDLDEALRRGRCATLAPLATLACAVEAKLS